MSLILHAAITCETLSAPENGMVSYSTNNNTMGTFSFGTEAYFSCDVGFSLVGDKTRTCGDGIDSSGFSGSGLYGIGPVVMSVGEFNGTTPACKN